MQHDTPDREPARAQLIGKIDGGPFTREPQTRLYRCDDCTGVFWFTLFFRPNTGLRVGLISIPIDPLGRSPWEQRKILHAEFERNVKCECDFRKPGALPPPWATPNDESH